MKERELVQALLNEIYNRVKRATTQEEKLSLILKPINKKRIFELSKEWENLGTSIEQIAQNILGNPKLYEFDDTSSESTFNVTHGLALAICSLNVGVCQYFVEHIPDINDNKITVWGYRQPYSPLHLVLDPGGHIFYLHFDGEHEQDTIERGIKIIQILARKKANPNNVGHINSGGIYNNPPIAAGEPSGHYGKMGYDSREKYFNIIRQLRGELVLHGVDLDVIGSCFRLEDKSKEELKQNAYLKHIKYILNDMDRNYALAPSTKEYFKKCDQKILKKVQDVSHIKLESEETTNKRERNKNDDQHDDFQKDNKKRKPTPSTI